MKKRQARLVSVFSAFATEISVFFLWKQTPSKMSGTKNIATQSRGRHVAFSMVFYVHIRCVAKLQVLTEVRCRNHMQQPFHFFSNVFYFFFLLLLLFVLFCFVLFCFFFPTIEHAIFRILRHKNSADIISSCNFRHALKGATLKNTRQISRNLLNFS